jgi:hypothetical protein
VVNQEDIGAPVGGALKRLQGCVNRDGYPLDLLIAPGNLQSVSGTVDPGKLVDRKRCVHPYRRTR